MFLNVYTFTLYIDLRTINRGELSVHDTLLYLGPISLL